MTNDLEMARLENQKFIAVINNLAKLVTTDKKVDSEIIKLMMSGIQNKEIKQIEATQKTKERSTEQ